MKVNMNNQEISNDDIIEDVNPLDNDTEDQNKAKRLRKIILIVDIIIILAIVGITIWLTIFYFDKIKLLTSSDGQEYLTKYIKDAKGKGFFILILIQVLQVVIAFIPGEVVEIVSGLLYGPWIGLLICEIGLVIGTLIIFGLVKLLGKPFVQIKGGNKKNNSKLKIFGDPVRALIILFSIFLIPGLPKDVIIYMVPFTKVKLRDFIIVSSIARIPSIITSTIVGDAMANGNYVLAFTIFGIMTVLAALVLIFNKKIYEFMDKMIKKRQTKSETVVEKE